ncbi:hypothetical protein DL767_000553 [Monosporascus sp. MG133]|nr:hypothetical protein DL767_000553 [Monosporascus sp. MG133]
MERIDIRIIMAKIQDMPRRAESLTRPPPYTYWIPFLVRPTGTSSSRGSRRFRLAQCLAQWRMAGSYAPFVEPAVEADNVVVVAAAVQLEHGGSISISGARARRLARASRADAGRGATPRPRKRYRRRPRWGANAATRPDVATSHASRAPRNPPPWPWPVACTCAVSTHRSASAASNTAAVNATSSTSSGASGAPLPPRGSRDRGVLPRPLEVRHQVVVVESRVAEAVRADLVGNVPRRAVVHRIRGVGRPGP